MQHNVIKFDSDLQQVHGFIWVLSFHNKIDCHYNVSSEGIYDKPMLANLKLHNIEMTKLYMYNMTTLSSYYKYRIYCTEIVKSTNNRANKGIGKANIVNPPIIPPKGMRVRGKVMFNLY